MNATPHRSATWARLGAEFVVIVLGVLIALWADALMQARQDREIEARYLAMLLEDVGESERLLAESNATRERMFAALGKVADSDLTGVSSDSIGRWVYDGLVLVGSFEPQFTALQDIRSSDQLRLLPASVRREVAELDRDMEFLSRMEDDLLRTQQQLVDPYLVEHTPLAGLLTDVDRLPLAPSPVSPADWVDLQTPELRNAIALKLSLGQIAAERRDAVSSALAELATEVQARLDEIN